MISDDMLDFNKSYLKRFSEDMENCDLTFKCKELSMATTCTHHPYIFKSLAIDCFALRTFANIHLNPSNVLDCVITLAVYVYDDLNDAKIATNRTKHNNNNDNNTSI